MKKKLIAGISLIMFTTGLPAKNLAGIYMNVADYRNNKLTYATNCDNQNVKIHLHDFFGNTSSFTIKHEGKKETLQKNEVYGYRDCKEQVYRFYANATYKLVEAGNIYIYTQERNIAQSKGFIVVDDYYFSTSPNGDIVRLTTESLVSAYHNNEKFIDLLENYRGTAADYDTRHKTFKVNYLYTRSLNN